MTDIFEFWALIKRGENIHPHDKKIFDRIHAERHGFQTNCLPACYAGRLRTAPVVLLFLSPGFDDKHGQDLKDAQSKEGKDYYKRRWAGDEPFPGDDNAAGVRWLKRITKPFDTDFTIIRDKVAILNIGAYHSKKMSSYASMLALPSSRISLSWAQNVLFPEAEAGRRIVLCMRSAAYWGLEKGRKYKGLLYAPYVTIGGHFIKNEENRQLLKKVHRVLNN